MGRYYIRAESPDVEVACTLLLELYVRAGCPRLWGQGREGAELLLRQEAREAVLTGRSRLLRVSGGGVGDAAGAAGARGLALFMAAFGVRVEFPAQELCDLVDVADVSACVEVLKASKLFVRKMRGEKNETYFPLLPLNPDDIQAFQIFHVPIQISDPFSAPVIRRRI